MNKTTDPITVFHPSAQSTVPQLFVATARANIPEIKSLRAYLIIAKTVQITARNCVNVLGASSCLFYFDLMTGNHSGPAKLVVEGISADGNTNDKWSVEIDFTVSQGGPSPEFTAPTISYPATDGYDIQNPEKQNFTSYGTNTNTISSATIGTISATYIFEDSPNNFWAASFPDLSGDEGNNQTLTVTDSSSLFATRTVDII